ncbi:MAG: zinc-binding dehydrogenase, partial [Candidatus Poribacteria bacterium]|nr:zinc-binding dehydrogenase [Candidatus Poribacteria bacterium]
TGYTVHCPDEFLSLWDGYSEFVCVRSDACLPLPDSISILDGSLIADTLGPAFTGVKAGEVQDKSVAVWGCGPVGQMAVQLCKAFGAKEIVALDPIDFRRQKAEEFGADIVMDPTACSPIEDLHRLGYPMGVDVGICATFAGNVPDRALLSTRLEGRFISVMGVARLNEDELRHRFSYGVHYFRRDHYDEMVKLVAEGRVNLKSVTTHTYPLEDIADAFRMRFSQQGQSLKVGVLTGAISESDTVSVF